MKVLGIDLSTRAGWAVLEGEPGPDSLPRLLCFGSSELTASPHEHGQYPWGYLAAADAQASNLLLVVYEHLPDLIVIEETNGSKNRYTQKLLEFLHAALLRKLWETKIPVVYVSTGDWRSVLAVKLTSDDKKLNAALSRAKAKDDLTAAKARLGVRGRVNKKHAAVRWVNETFHLALKVKHNDEADAICQVVAYFRGVSLSTGINKKKEK